ncbi:alpha/beta-hydrolases superfamily protein [Anaeramoeba ignava]|uniref:Alpha/beta-hydrolases superfamily protein n=1 Tax=Anaeramoeba ignava TaxID=1746090 RepID=A0A9Q0RDT1_ANAIG|nr:alpha/beta-hydrolases superfamily protein [Anaeramoeba ignava]
MGQLLNKIVFSPPDEPPQLEKKRLSYIKITKKQKIPILWFTPQDVKEDIFEMIRLANKNKRRSGNLSIDTFSRTKKKNQTKKQNHFNLSNIDPLDENSLVITNESLVVNHSHQDPKSSKFSNRQILKKEKKIQKYAFNPTNSTDDTNKENRLSTKDQGTNESNTTNQKNDLEIEIEIEIEKTKEKKQKEKIKKNQIEEQKEPNFYKNPGTEPKFTLIFSHGNGESISLLQKWAKKICYRLNVNILLYEYPGYPFTEGEHNEENCYKAGIAAYEYLISVKKIPSNRIILFGHSLGTGVTVELANQKQSAGVILMSPLLSCMKVVVKTKKRLPYDMFCNFEKLKNIKVPTLVLHGTDDKLIPFNHGKTVYSLLPNSVDPLWITGAGHNNIVFGFPDLFFPRVERFLIFLENKMGTQTQQQSVKIKKTKFQKKKEFEQDFLHKKIEMENRKLQLLSQIRQVRFQLENAFFVEDEKEEDSIFWKKEDPNEFIEENPRFWFF